MDTYTSVAEIIMPEQTGTAHKDLLIVGTVNFPTEIWGR